MMTGAQAARRLKTFIQVSLCATLAIVVLGVAAGTVLGEEPAEEQSATKEQLDNEVKVAIVNNVGSGLIAAGIAAGVSAIAAGVAVAYVGAAAVFGRTIIFVALGEGIAVLGLVIAMLILNNVTMMLNL